MIKMSQEEMKVLLKNFNMRKVSEATGISYDILRNFSCGRTQYLKTRYALRLEQFFKNLVK